MLEMDKFLFSDFFRFSSTKLSFATKNPFKKLKRVWTFKKFDFLSFLKMARPEGINSKIIYL